MKELPEINTEIYHKLGERWYTAQDDPVALLRAESRLLTPWIVSEIKTHFQSQEAQILDVGCGAGFFSNAAAKLGLKITGIDQSEPSLQVAQKHDATQSVKYKIGNAENLPFQAHSFDAIVMLDFLEHVDSPERIIAEASRVLKPNGLFFFHTFNRNLLSWLVVIKGVEWFVKNTPEHLHLLKMFIKPKELIRYCAGANLKVKQLQGVGPKLFSKAGVQLLKTKIVPFELEFQFTQNTLLSYCGFAVKKQ